MEESICDSELQEIFAGIASEIVETINVKSPSKRLLGFRYDIWDNDHEESIYPEDKELKVEEKYKYSERTKIL